jgi:hypothetical protein
MCSLPLVSIYLTNEGKSLRHITQMKQRTPPDEFQHHKSQYEPSRDLDAISQDALDFESILNISNAFVAYEDDGFMCSKNRSVLTDWIETSS